MMHSGGMLNSDREVFTSVKTSAQRFDDVPGILVDDEPPAGREGRVRLTHDFGFLRLIDERRTGSPEIT